MLEYPHTENINDFIKSQVKDFNNKDNKFIATIKIHGSNTAICMNRLGGTWLQTRNRVLTGQSDHLGFKEYIQADEHKYYKSIVLASNIAITKLGHSDFNIAIYGEWCGGEVQKNVALTGQQKEWIVFDIATFSDLKPNDTTPQYFFSKEEVIEVCRANGVKCIYDFPHWEFDLNFFKMGDVIEEIASKVKEIETECPVAKQLHGVSGVGEGLYFKCHNDGKQLFFKAKGKLHAGASKVKTVSTNVKDINVNMGVLDLFTTERLTQGIHYLQEQGLPIRDSSFKTFLTWAVADVEREEKNYLDENGIELKEQLRYVGSFVRKWWEENSLLVMR